MLLPGAIFELKIYKMRLRPGFRSGPHWGSLQRSSDPLVGLKAVVSLQPAGEGEKEKAGDKIQSLFPWTMCHLFTEFCENHKQASKQTN